jgi:hypothetical protein
MPEPVLLKQDMTVFQSMNGRKVGTFLILFGLIFGGLPILPMLEYIPSGIQLSGLELLNLVPLLGFSVFILIGAGCVLLGILILPDSSSTAVDLRKREFVFKEQRRFPKRVNIHERVGFRDVEALRLSSKLESHTDRDNHTHYYTKWTIHIELKGQAEPKEVYASSNEQHIRELATQLSQEGQWPIHELSDNGEMTVQTPREQHQPFYRQDEISLVKDAPAQPSERIRVLNKSDGLQLAILPSRSFGEWAGLIIGTLIWNIFSWFIAFICVWMFFQPEIITPETELWMKGVIALMQAVLVGPFLGIGLFLVWTVIYRAVGRQRFDFNHQGLESWHEVLGKRYTYQRIPASSITQIQVTPSGTDKKLVFRTEAKPFEIGLGLPESDLKWLQQQAYQYLSP